MIKISETSFTQCFDDSMSSFSSEKENKYYKHVLEITKKYMQ